MEDEVQTAADTPNQPAAVPGRISPGVLLFLLSGVAGLVVAGLMLFTQDTAAPQAAQAGGGMGSIRNRPAAAFETETLDGQTVTLADYAGRPVFINFWATWCVPCVKELPAFEEFAQQQGDTGAVVLAVNQGEGAEDIRAFLDELGVNGLTVLLDPDLDISGQYGVAGLPTTYLVDANGILRYFKLGEMTLEEMNGYLEAIQESSNEAAS